MAKGRIEIDIDKCKGCELCITACKHNVIALSNKKEVNTYGYNYLTVINANTCTGCAMCGQMCPDSAIEVYKEKKSS